MTEQQIKEQADAYADVDINSWQQQLIAEFRENNGKMSGMFEGWSLLVVSTIGARSGLVRSCMVARVEVGGQLIIVASAMGAPKHPAWYHNIRNNPKVTVETGTETYEAIAAIPSGAQRDKLFDKVVEVAPGYGDYQAKTTREIPVVVLHRIGQAPGAERVKGMGDFPGGGARLAAPGARGAAAAGGGDRRGHRGFRHVHRTIGTRPGSGDAHALLEILRRPEEASHR
jgi:deazaflavin-dependent oxidoreductase (nitroreductase family)